MLLRTAQDLILQFDEDGKIVCYSMSTKNRCRFELPVLTLLHKMSSPVLRDDLVATYPEQERADTIAAIEVMERYGYVARVGSDGVVSDPHPDWWDAWGVAARHFHSATRDVNFVSYRTERSFELADELSHQGDLPPISKSYRGVRTLPLPRTFSPLDISLAQALKARRTNRDFTTEPVSIDDFSTILHYTFAPQRFQDTGPFGTQMVKASPAGGSRHDIECYVYPRNVHDVPPSLYHYNNMDHCLELIREDIDDEHLQSIMGDQEYCIRAGFLCFLTSVTNRIAFKYRHPRAYRTWMYNVGHAGQTFALTATGLGLGPFQTAAFHDSSLEGLLGVDSNTEFCTYVVGAGVPERRIGKQPKDFRPAQLS